MNHSTILRFSTVVISVLLISFLYFTGCEKEVEKIVTQTVHDTTIVTVTDTVIITIISVDSVHATPDSIAQGGSIELSVDISTMPKQGDLSFLWLADEGEFTTDVTNDTVTWKAPDDPNTYVVSVHVTDGENIAIGSRRIGVGMYAATVTPYYIGEAVCATCHATTHGEWELTGHAEAWAGLMSSGHPQSFCFPCHAVGFEGPTGNSGYDEAPIAIFEDVQCENCHGPGSDHAADPTGVHPEVSYEADNCGKCHEGTHHPYLSEWEASPHNFDPHVASHGAGVNSFCEGCHEGVAAATRLSGDVSVFYGSGSVGRPDTVEAPYTGITCQTCHNSHSDENIGQLRTVDDVPLVTANGESPVITVGGSGKLCMHCHHARRGPENQIQNGYAHFGPHANPQADMMLGASAYHGVATGFTWAGPSHLNVINSCKTCHLPMSEFNTLFPDSAVTGHEFLPKVQACQDCHGPINDFRDIMALEDFDGDGTIEGVMDEVDGLMDILETALVDSFAARGITIGDTDELLDSLGSVTASSFKMREAGYNFAFVHDDKSHGIHNPDYCVQLLQQSFQYLTTMPVPGAAIVREDNAVAGMW